MKTAWLSVVLAAALYGSTAMATDINISVQQTNGTNEITVAPGEMVDYKVFGVLTDDVNEGLALIGLSLHFTGGPLTPANTPLDGDFTCTNPMRNFVKPEGMTNPDGYDGTVIGPDLIQCGGAQNTINNTVGNAAFPIGAVLTGVAQPAGCGPAVILTGSFLVPADLAPGPYTLDAFDIFANVILDGEDGNPFWATEPAGLGSVTNLAITVGDVPVALVSSYPPFTGFGVATVPAQGALWRSAGNVVRLTFDGALPGLPGAGQLLIQEMLAGGAAGQDLSASFAFTLESGDMVLRIRDGLTTTPTANLTHRRWYVIRNTGGWAGVANFVAEFPVQAGDASGDNRVLQADAGLINTFVPCLTGCGDQNRNDINGDARVLQADVGQAASSVSSLPVVKPTGW